MTNENESQHEQIIILGSGPAGLSAALYAARAERNPLVLTGTDLGGQASLTNMIENYPGFPDGVGGVELATLMQKQAENFGARIEMDTVTSVNLSKRPYEIKTYSKTYLAESLIIATGASPVHLNVPGEQEFTGQGVSYCATCDGWFFRDRKVVVVGGGDSALEEALFLTRFASEIVIIHRRDEFRAGALLQSRAESNKKIRMILNTVVNEIEGGNGVKKVSLTNVKTGEISELETDGVFIFIGHNPNTELFQGQLAMDARGYLQVDSHLATSVTGVFAAGEVADPTFRQVVTSAGMGAAAAMQADKFLSR
ncbi:MAG TPA: thioredoxin-disulfide reductase [Anaerolineaceae bacterium]|jgi:thioredoxin reductase (NADPH)|nr:thioredoxin-disulfide reductase [Anaerolineaceae bacterium]